jgi:hypothetical protein
MTTERIKTLLSTIHSFGIGEFTAGQLMHRCAGLSIKQHQPLYDAIVAACGVKPNSKKLGHTLKRIAGRVYGQFRIDGAYSTDKRLWVYSLIAGAELIEDVGAHTEEGAKVLIAESKANTAMITELIKTDDKLEKEEDKQRPAADKAADKAAVQSDPELMAVIEELKKSNAEQRRKIARDKEDVHPADSILNPHMTRAVQGNWEAAKRMSDAAPEREGYTKNCDGYRVWYVPIENARRVESMRGADGVLRFNDGDSVSYDAETAEQHMRGLTSPSGPTDIYSSAGFARACAVRNSEHTPDKRDTKDRRWW